MQIVDSHCHLNIIKRQQNLAEVIQAAQNNDVVGMLNISVELTELDDLRQQCELMPNIWMSAGIHPCHCEGVKVSYVDLLEASQGDKVVAVGESGLDFFHQSKQQSGHQFEHFENHLMVAKEIKKPIIIHCRNSAEDVVRTLQQHSAAECSGVMHCFAEDKRTAEAALELGFYISFSGILTFNSAKELREVAKIIPMDKLLVETDSPYLAPVPYRGKNNQPAYVRNVLSCIAELKGVNLAELAEQTTLNFQSCFNVTLQ